MSTSLPAPISLDEQREKSRQRAGAYYVENKAQVRIDAKLRYATDPEYRERKLQAAKRAAEANPRERRGHIVES
jgi:hypothetical protein